MKGVIHRNHVAYLATFVLGYGWGGFSVLSGKVASLSALAIAISVVTIVALGAHALSLVFRVSSDADSEPSGS